MRAAEHPLSIALLTYSTQLRGSVVHTLELATALSHLGHEVCVYALDKHGQGFDRAIAPPHHLIPAQPAPAEIDALIQQRIQEFTTYFSRNPKPHQIYHAQDCIGANALLQLRQQGQIPHFVRTVHHIESFTSTYLQQCQEHSIRTPDLCLCVSHYWQAALQKDYGIHAPQVINGIDRHRFTPTANGTEAQIRQHYGLQGSPIYLTVGGIDPRKNSIRLLQAFAQVQAEHPNAQLVIAGGATLFDYQPYRDQFFAIATQLNLPIGQALILPGVIPAADLPALYRTADAFVFPSVKEGWGLVILEAIACGLPVITAHQPPFTEFLNADQALLIDPRDTSAIAQAMRTILQPEVARSLRQASLPLLQQYTWQASAQMHIQQYQTLLQRQPIPLS